MITPEELDRRFQGALGNDNQSYGAKLAMQVLHEEVGSLLAGVEYQQLVTMLIVVADMAASKPYPTRVAVQTLAGVHWLYERVLDKYAALYQRAHGVEQKPLKSHEDLMRHIQIQANKGLVDYDISGMVSFTFEDIMIGLSLAYFEKHSEAWVGNFDEHALSGLRRVVELTISKYEDGWIEDILRNIDVHRAFEELLKKEEGDGKD